MAAASATLLLPAPARLGDGPPDPRVARALGRADRTAGAAGSRAQLSRHFDLLPRGWPVAALTRMHDAGDTGQSAWLRADPAYVRPDINGARLLACGEGLQLSRRDVEAFLPALRPLFGDAGVPLDAPDAHRWYLQLPRGARLPTFAPPDEALGADLFEHLPGSDDGAGPEGRRWRALLSEAQVVLHNHPHNAARIAAGLLPVNSLWFWGAGTAPDHVASPHAGIATGEVLASALGAAAGLHPDPLPRAFAVPPRDTLFDLRHARDVVALQADWLLPALAAVDAGGLARLVLDFEDGTLATVQRSQRWRFWRRPAPAFAA